MCRGDEGLRVGDYWARGSQALLQDSVLGLGRTMLSQPWQGAGADRDSQDSV